MKDKHRKLALYGAKRAGFALGLTLAFGWLGLALAALINPFVSPLLGTSYPVIGGGNLSQITGASTNNQEILWEHEVIQSAAMSSPFADNMTGGIGSGKPIIVKNDTKVVQGQYITIPTVGGLGYAGVFGNGTRVGSEEALNPGDFQLKVDLWWTGTGIDNAAKAQSILGGNYDKLAQSLLANRLEKKQSDDNMMLLRIAATAGFNIVYANNKTLDTLLSADTFQTSLVTGAAGRLKDIGGKPMNVRSAADTMKNVSLPAIPRYLMFSTDQNARPIKTESAYLQAVQYGAERGTNVNNNFTGDIASWDGHIIYPWQVFQHGDYATIGSPLQPEALLGTAIVAKGSSTSFPGGLSSSTAGGLDGGGNATGAALTLVNWFEFFNLFTYKPINGVTGTVGTGTRYFAIINSTDSLVSFFSFTGNTGRKLTGLTRLGSTIAGDYNTTVGGVTWNSGAWTTASDGAGYAGVTEGAIPAGSLIVETNSKGVPIGESLVLGEMALVCGYGRIALPNGGFKTMANRTNYTGPHNQAFSDGIEVSYGSAAYKRPDGKTPNFVRAIHARKVSGMPVVSS